MSNRINELHWTVADTLGVGANLDSERTPGFYDVTDPIGLPAGDYQMLIMAGLIKNVGQVNVIQLLFGAVSTVFQKRHFDGATWSAWASMGSGGGGGSTVNLGVKTNTATTLQVEAINGVGTGAAVNMPLASASVAGILAAADKSKLDAIAADNFFNVQTYGAIPGGPARAEVNRIAFTAAIAAAAAAGGGVIYAPRGVYYISYGGSAALGGVRLGSNMTLQGDGIGVTVIKMADIGNNDVAGVVRTESAVENSNVIVRDLTIDGNKAEQTGWANVICFFAGVTPNVRNLMDRDIWCINVECRNGRNGTAGSANLARGYGFDPHEVVDRFAAVNCIAHDNERDGFVLDGVTNFSLTSCKSWNNGRYGFNIITECFNGLVDNCHAYNNGTQGAGNHLTGQGDSHDIQCAPCRSEGGPEQGFRIRRGPIIVNSNITIRGCTIVGSGKNGIQLTGALYNVIDGNLLINNGQLATNTYMDIAVDEDDGDTTIFTAAKFNVIKNNYAVALAANKTKAAYRENSAASAPPTDNMFAWNEASGQLSSKYLEISTLSSIRDRGILDSYNVADWGIKGDNATDNGPKLRALQTFVESRGGGEIFFPPGTYRASGTGTASQGVMALASNITLRGSGMGQTVIKAIDPVNVSITGVIRTKSGLTNSNVTVADLSITTEAVTGTGDVSGFHAGGSNDPNLFLDNVEVFGMDNGTANAGYGIRLTSSAANAIVAGCFARNNQRDGIYIDGADHVRLLQPRVENNTRYNLNIANGADFTHVLDQVNSGAGSHGLFVTDDAAKTQIQGGTILGAVGAGLKIKRGATVTDTTVSVRGTHIEACSQEGISLAGASRNSIIGCTFVSNGLATNNNFADIRLENEATGSTVTSDFNVIHSNLFLIPATGNKVAYNIAETTAQANNNNYFLDNVSVGTPGTGVYLKVGGGTVVRDYTTSGTAAGADGEFQRNVAGSFAGASGLIYDVASQRPVAVTGLITGTLPVTAPPLSTQTVFGATQRAGVAMPAVLHIKEKMLQHALMDRSWGQFIPNTNSVTLTVPGFANTTSGTATARAFATTTRFTQAKRIGYVSTATAGNSAGVRQSSRMLWRGNGVNLGGFTASFFFGFPTTPTTPRFFAGVYGASSFAADAGNPSAAVDLFGVGIDTGQTTLRMLWNDATGTASSSDLGANFPITAGAMYELFLHTESNVSAMDLFIRRLDLPFQQTLTAATDLPTSNVVMAPQITLHNGATAEAVEIDIMGMYYETPF